MTLTEVGIVIGVEPTEKQMHVHNCGMMWFTEFFAVSVKENNLSGVLGCASGRGKTRTESRKSLAEEIAGKILVLNPYNNKRREFQLPPTITGKI